MSSPATSPTGHSEATQAVPGTQTATRRALTDRQSDTLARLLDATAEELKEQTWSGLTVRNVARRAGVAPATAYTYFASREHLVTEVYRRRLTSLPEPDVDPVDAPADRVSEVLSPIGLLVADEPELASAVTVAMLSEDAEVARLREEIGMLTAAWLRAATLDDATPAQLLTLESAFSGLLLSAGMGYRAYSEIPARMAEVATVTFHTSEGSPTQDSPSPEESQREPEDAPDRSRGSR